MTTKRLQFFSTLDEVLIITGEAASFLELNVFLYRVGAVVAVRKADCEKLNYLVREFDASRIYLAENGLAADTIDPENIELARLGLIQVILPQSSDKILLMSEVAIRTDWTDATTGEVFENQKLLSLFNRVKKELSRYMIGPVVGKNIVTGGEAVYPNIKYTTAVKAFVAQGGGLMQGGVDNVRFYLLS